MVEPFVLVNISSGINKNILRSRDAAFFWLSQWKEPQIIYTEDIFFQVNYCNIRGPYKNGHWRLKLPISFWLSLSQNECIFRVAAAEQLTISMLGFSMKRGWSFIE